MLDLTDMQSKTCCVNVTIIPCYMCVIVNDNLLLCIVNNKSYTSHGSTHL